MADDKFVISNNALFEEEKKKRKPSQYSMFLSEQMRKLALDKSIPSKDRMKIAIKMYQEKKIATSVKEDK